MRPWVSIGILLLAACSGSQDDEQSIRDPGRDGSVQSGDSGEPGSDAGDEETELDGSLPDDASGDGDGDGNDAGNDATDAGDGGGPTVPATFVSPTGNDANSGAREAPLLTIAHAVTVGSNVVLLDGTFDRTTEVGPTATDFPLLNIPDGVSIRADHPGLAVINGRGTITNGPNRNGPRFMGSGSAQGLVVRGFVRGIVAEAGDVTLQDIRFEDISDVGVDVSGTAMVQLNAQANALYGDAQLPGVARVSDAAELHVKGGRVEGGRRTYSCSSAFFADGTSKLFLEDVSLANSELGIVYTGGSTAEATLLRVNADAMSTNNCACIYLNGSASRLKVQDSAITNSGSRGIVSNQFGFTVEIINSSISGSANDAVSLFDDTNKQGVGSFKATDSHFDDGFSGLVLTRLGSVELTNVTIDGNDRDGLLLSSGWNMNLKVRGTSVQNNGFTGVGLTVTGAASALDFGKLGEPGGNTFRNNNASNSGRYNFNVSTASGLVTQAVGNTWVANTQGTDGSGHYPAPAPGAHTDGTSASAAGVNYVVAPAGAILRLAETAP